MDRVVLDPGFRGYHVIFSRNITQRELAPNGWAQVPIQWQDGDPGRYKDLIQKPFAKWFVFERNIGFDSEHGAERFSLLYICADGVAAFQALYVSNDCFPKAVAVIQPGTGFGMDWTDFTDPERVFARTVLSNPAGKPGILLDGGIGPRRFYRSPCWQQYSTHVDYFPKTGGGSVGIWQYNAVEKDPVHMAAT